MSFDVAAVRRTFPILGQAVGGHALHYLDNAATAQVPQAVLDAIVRHETTARANIHRSVHTLAERATEAYEAARATLARFMAVPAEQVVFTASCTTAINLVAHAFGAGLKPGDRITLTAAEHHANLVPWHLLAERSGVALDVIPVDGAGLLDLDHLDRAIGAQTRLVAVAYASNVTGAVAPLAPIVARARQVGARVLVDGAQAGPHGPLDVGALDVDFFVLAGHKMFGPNGIGVLWMAPDLIDSLPPFLGGGDMIRSVEATRSTYAEGLRRFEAGTPPIAQAIGLAAAADWLAGLDHEGAEAHMARLTGRILDGLGAIPGVDVKGPLGLQGRVPIVSFTMEGAHPHDICQILDGHGVACRGGHHCAQPLMAAFGIAGTTRASLAPYNDDGDVDALLDGLAAARRILVR
ncbi:aminotransferase class V-fold PLP-dependent enzyme [Zavarzinia sp. CC-PAN008]|uniref:aminotransferase class V-fold PLP-dependent enzyme n=1 Tax=Zavarzinia sp. CC-PAN008 TaxID=3243332 RepID=UPI003F746829